MGHTLAWLLWTLGAAVPALLIRNPLYLAIIGLAAAVVYAAAGQGSDQAQSWRALLKIGALMWFVAIPLNALMVHQGRYVLFRLPLDWPLVGGAITLEAMAYGFVAGLAIWVLLLIFATFNVCVDASELLRLAPPFLYQAGVVTSIALTFMPQMLSSAREIREAQRIRGHRFRGWRSLLPLFVPLVTTGLEHAIQLAESMEARGFGGELTGMSPRQGNRLRLAMIVALAMALAGLFLQTYYRQRPELGLALLVAAGVALIACFAALGRHVRRSRFRRTDRSAADLVVAGSGLIVALGVVAVRAMDRMALIYYPYPPYSPFPAFDPLVGALLMLLAVPGVVWMLREAGRPVSPSASADSAADAAEHAP